MKLTPTRLLSLLVVAGLASSMPAKADAFEDCVKAAQKSYAACLVKAKTTPHATACYHKKVRDIANCTKHDDMNGGIGSAGDELGGETHPGDKWKDYSPSSGGPLDIGA